MTELQMDDGIRNLIRLSNRPEDDEAWKQQLWTIIEPRDPRVLRKLWTMRPFDTMKHYLESDSISDVVVHFPVEVWMAEFVDALPELVARNAACLLDDTNQSSL